MKLPPPLPWSNVKVGVGFCFLLSPVGSGVSVCCAIIDGDKGIYFSQKRVMVGLRFSKMTNKLESRACHHFFFRSQKGFFHHDGTDEL
jgi:hypothetical protein